MPSCLLPALTLALAAGVAGAAVAGEGDPLASAGCRRALEALQAGEGGALAAPRTGPPPDGDRLHADRARLEALRRRAAQACLGRGDVPSLRGRLARPPVAVPPVTVLPAPPPPPAVQVPPPVRVDPPPVVTSCDAGGCWTSDGTRLHRAGPGLLGPRGFCIEQAGMLQCP